MGAFTRLELAACLAAVALLTLVSLPASASSTRAAGKGVLCLANQRQLAAAMQLYTHDNNDAFPENFHGGDALDGGAANSPTKAPWALGWLDWGVRSDNTNETFLRVRRYARLGPYLRSSQNVHKCPEDVFLSLNQRALGWRERVRTVSLNATVGGGNAAAGPWSPEYVQVKSLRDLAALQMAPSDLNTFADEHPDSINDPLLFPPLQSWIDLPASLHDGAGSFAFADGHAELHEWRGSARQRVRVGTFSSVAPAADPDIQWLRAHSARRAR